VVTSSLNGNLANKNSNSLSQFLANPGITQVDSRLSSVSAPNNHPGPTGTYTFQYNDGTFAPTIVNFTSGSNTRTFSGRLRPNNAATLVNSTSTINYNIAPNDLCNCTNAIMRIQVRIRVPVGTNTSRW
jgi:hypothetical protein